MTIKAVRDELAAGITAATALGVFGYARPPGLVGVFPAAVVQDPNRISYHETAGRRTVVELAVRVIVGRSGVQDQVDRLDELITYSNLPKALEDITGASWTSIAVTESVGGYADFAQGKQIVGVAADLLVRLTLTN